MAELKKVRWGIIGAGHIAQSFIKDFPLLHNAELIAVAARDKEKAKVFAAAHNIPLAYSYDELYKSTEVDAVYIATTHNFHFEQSMLCIQHGKGVLCEKPITINDKEFKQLAVLAKEKDVFLMEAMWTYFLPAIIKAQQWVREGRIGAIKVIQADFAFPMEKNMEGRMYSPLLAGGALLDLGVYNVALTALFMNRKPDSITACGVLTETGVDATTTMLFKYGDTVATLCTSMVTRMTNKLRLFGETGYIEIPEFWRAKTAALYDREYRVLENFDDARTSHGFIYQMQHATDKILNNEIESNIIPHKRSNEIQEVMTDVRRQIGLQYPSEKKS
jgi:predicted dehydrogenase